MTNKFDEAWEKVEREKEAQEQLKREKWDALNSLDYRHAKPYAKKFLKNFIKHSQTEFVIEANGFWKSRFIGQPRIVVAAYHCCDMMNEELNKHGFEAYEDSSGRDTWYNTRAFIYIRKINLKN